MKTVQERALIILQRVGAIITGHFILTSGLHAKVYINKDAVYMHSKKISLLCRYIANHFVSDRIEVVIAPATGGIILSQWVAYHLSKITRRDVLAVYAEKDETTKGFVIKRGYDKVIKGKRVLVVEDILTTGGSVKKVVELVRAHGGIVVGLGALCNRGKVTSADVANSAKFFSLVDIDVQTWTKEECPLCATSVRINTDLGKGKDYLAQKNESK